MSGVGITAPDLAVRLFGAARAAPVGTDVIAGRLSFRLEGLALRWLRWDGIEFLRGIAFVVRDRDWGTYAPEVTLEAEERGTDKTALRLAAHIAQRQATLACRVSVMADATGLTVSGTATARGRFTTNRAGFVVLHPAACAGRTVRVAHTDGSTSAGRFPSLISPHQPFFDIAAIEHEALTGVSVHVAFSGEAFEMEDQRNWSDASFKTYSRPLARPYPYAIDDGETVAQSVRVAVHGTLAAGQRSRRRHAPRIEVTDGPPVRLPRLGIGGQPGEFQGSAAQLARLAALRPALLLAEFRATVPDSAALAGYRAALEATGAKAAVMLRPDPTGGLAPALDALALAGIRPAELALANADEAAVRLARRALPAARIGAGTDAFFAEFNRAPPPSAGFVFWTVTPTVHATDDASVMETLPALAHQAATARARHPGTALWCGPVTLRMRFNPNAAAASPPTPDVAPTDMDARQRGLFGACFTLGQIAAWSAAGLETLVLHAPFGPSGLIHARAKFPQPWYDALTEGAVYPVWQVMAGLAGQSGAALRTMRNDAPEHVVALATADALWVGNLGTDAIEIALPGTRARVLDADSFAEAATEPDEFWIRGTKPLASGLLRLGAYAVGRVT